MKIGDLVKYRDRIKTDPEPDGIHDGWGNMGIVVKIFSANWGLDLNVPSVEYVDLDGDWIICKQEDVEVIND